MIRSDLRRATLDEIEEMDRRGALSEDPGAPAGTPLGDDFWASATAVPAPAGDTIVLPVARGIMEWFKQEYENYPQRMNAILSDHMTAAQKKKAG